MYKSWQAPQPGGAISDEQVLAFDKGRDTRLLVLAPLFDEHNKLRRQVVQIMRQIDTAGIDAFCPDLPGCNESLAPLENQTLAGWQDAALAAAERIGATHVFALRGATLFAPIDLPRFLYAPVKGKSLLKSLVRGRIIASKEAGVSENSEELFEKGRREGVELAGWKIGSEMFRELEAGEAQETGETTIVEQAEVGGAPLWLRAEPDENPAQASTLSQIVVQGVTEQ